MNEEELKALADDRDFKGHLLEQAFIRCYCAIRLTSKARMLELFMQKLTLESCMRRAL